MNTKDQPARDGVAREAAVRKVAQKLFERQHSLWKTHWEMAQPRGCQE